MPTLNLIKSEYFEEYKQNLKFDLKSVFNRIALKEIDFDFYMSSSAVYSSNIEGNSLDIETYWANKASQFLKKSKEEIEIEDLIKAYKFAETKILTFANMLKAHKLITKSFLINSACGKIRTQKVAVFNNLREIIYLAIEPEFAEIETKKLFDDIKILLKTVLSIEEVFYYASMIHLVFAKIHPFMDGNGRMARLLEKWFLSKKLGKNAWAIESELYYWKNRPAYYENIHIGVNYYECKYEKSQTFLKMLISSINQ